MNTLDSKLSFAKSSNADGYVKDEGDIQAAQRQLTEMNFSNHEENKLSKQSSDLSRLSNDSDERFFLKGEFGSKRN